MKKALLILAVMFAVVGCKDKNNDVAGSSEQFVAKMSIEGAFANGVPILAFNEDEHQYAVNAIRKSFRIQSDDGATCLAVIQNSELKSLSQKGTIDIEIQGLWISGGSYSVEVVKVANGKVWLWDATNKMGFVMPAL